MANAIASGSATTPTITPATTFGSQCCRASRPAARASSRATTIQAWILGTRRFYWRPVTSSAASSAAADLGCARRLAPNGPELGAAPLHREAENRFGVDAVDCVRLVLRQVRVEALAVDQQALRAAQL